MGVELDKKKYQDIGDAVGMPDQKDKDYIRNIILRFEKNNPSMIKHLIDEARKESSADEEFGLVSGKNQKVGISSNSGRYMMELPEQLHEQIEAYIPTIFRSKKHFAWFCRNFKELMLPRRH